MGVADLDGARVRVPGISVMKVDQTLAGTDGRPEQELDFTALSREAAKGTLVINRAIHHSKVPDASDTVGLIVAGTTQPDEILQGVCFVDPVLAMMNVNARTHVAEPAQGPRVLEPEVLE